MRGKLPGFGVLVLPLFVVTVTVTLSACNGTESTFSATGPAPLVANLGVNSSFGVEPASLRSEIVPASCDSQSASGIRVGVIVRGDEDVIVKSVLFRFEDRRGRRKLPHVIPLPSLSSPLPGGLPIPTSSPIPMPGIAPLPSATTIPFPGATAPVTGFLVRPGSHRQLDFLLHFGCGEVIPEGQIVIVIESADRDGRLGTSELRARVGS
jgi:hypothetical protein